MMVQNASLFKGRKKQIELLYKSTWEQKDDQEDAKMVKSLILLKEMAEDRRMKKLSNCYQGSAPKDESSF